MRSLPFLIALFLIPMVAIGQNLPDGNPQLQDEFRTEFMQIENEIEARGDDPLALPVGYSFTRPKTGDTLTLSSSDFEYGAWGVLFSHSDYWGESYDTYEDFRDGNQNDALTTQQAETNTVTKTVIPWQVWAVLTFLSLIVLGLLFALWRQRRDRAESNRQGARGGGSRMSEVERDRNRELPQTGRQLITDEKTRYFRPGAYRDPDEKRTVQQVNDDLDELTDTHFGSKWGVLPETIEQGVIRGQDLNFFRYNPAGDPLGSEQPDQPLEVTGYRALAEHQNGERQFVYALAPCMNFAEPHEESDFEFFPEGDSIIGTRAEIVEVHNTDDDVVEVLLEHPTLGELVATDDKEVHTPVRPTSRNGTN